jgi:hypothetical protein
MSCLERYHSKLWDDQIADDLNNGRLDNLFREVENEYEAGMASPL